MILIRGREWPEMQSDQPINWWVFVLSSTPPPTALLSNARPTQPSQCVSTPYHYSLQIVAKQWGLREVLRMGRGVGLIALAHRVRG